MRNGTSHETRRRLSLGKPAGDQAPEVYRCGIVLVESTYRGAARSAGRVRRPRVLFDVSATIAGDAELRMGFIESFNACPGARRPLPGDCKVEIMRFIALIPLARLNFRLPVDEQVTCSDASSVVGVVCASHGLTRVGNMVGRGVLRGQLPELRTEHTVLTTGIFDGIGALRVAVDVLGLEMVGHVSNEKDPSARRVVESQFPQTRDHHFSGMCEESVTWWRNILSGHRYIA